MSNELILGLHGSPWMWTWFTMAVLVVAVFHAAFVLARNAKLEHAKEIHGREMELSRIGAIADTVPALRDSITKLEGEVMGTSSKRREGIVYGANFFAEHDPTKVQPWVIWRIDVIANTKETADVFSCTTKEEAVELMRKLDAAYGPWIQEQAVKQ